MINNGSARTADEKSPWTQPGFIAAAAIVAIIVVLGLVIAITGGPSDDAAGHGANAPAAPPATTGNVDGPCGTKNVSTQVPDTAPDAKWELVGKMIAPTAPDKYGPGQVEDGFRTCFERSPIGALYAAVSFWATLTAKTDGQTYRRLAVKSPARDRAIAAAKGQRTPQLDGLQLAGFAFSSYALDRTVIKLAFRVEDGRFVSADTPLVWTQGDWRYEVPLDQGRGSVSQIAGLGGFIEWKGA
jgi:hypothetical protein